MRALPYADLLAVRGRVDHLESSYSEILSLLKRNSRDDSTTHTTESQDPPQSSIEVQPQSTDFVSPTRTRLPPGENTGVENLSLEEFEALIKAYRRMSQLHFPYVLIPEECPAQSLYRERPMLARAIIIVTSWRNPGLQAVMRISFLRNLMEKYFILNERSLELLQALIVYFGW